MMLVFLEFVTTDHRRLQELESELTQANNQLEILQTQCQEKDIQVVSCLLLLLLLLLMLFSFMCL
jgi:hypothetical protein